MTIELNLYRHAILANPAIGPDDESLLVERHGRLACYYAPFEHINSNAKVVLVGITPGAQQARNALNALRSSLIAGASDADALAAAKRTASFSGSMRNVLVALLDRVGLHDALGQTSCGQLFGDRGGLVHFTSVLRNPVFVDGNNYRGNPSILKTPFLRQMCERWFGTEVDAMPDVLWVPLGKEPTSVLQYFVQQGRVPVDRVLDGLPHPSPGNCERTAYFLGNKVPEALSNKTNAAALDRRREILVARIRALSQPSQMPATARAHAVETSPPPAVSALSRTRQAARKGASATVDQAEALLAARFDRIKSGNKKIAGFQTRRGRQLAIQRDVQCLNVWTEDLEPPTYVSDHERYTAQRTRHSNLVSQAPRIAYGKSARMWRPADVAQLQALIEWYDHA